MGVRIGTSEIYRAVETLNEVVETLAVDLEDAEGQGDLILFVTTPQGVPLDPALVEKIRKKIRSDLSPRHVPDEIIQAPSIPKTLNGKKLEVPVKRIMMGGDPEKVLNRDSLSDPGSVEFFAGLAKERSAKRK